MVPRKTNIVKSAAQRTIPEKFHSERLRRLPLERRRKVQTAMLLTSQSLEKQSQAMAKKLINLKTALPPSPTITYASAVRTFNEIKKEYSRLANLFHIVNRYGKKYFKWFKATEEERHESQNPVEKSLHEVFRNIEYLDGSFRYVAIDIKVLQKWKEKQ